MNTKSLKKIIFELKNIDGAIVKQEIIANSSVVNVNFPIFLKYEDRVYMWNGKLSHDDNDCTVYNVCYKQIETPTIDDFIAFNKLA
jgi:hypothetical protein